MPDFGRFDRFYLSGIGSLEFIKVMVDSKIQEIFVEGRNTLIDISYSGTISLAKVSLANTKVILIFEAIKIILRVRSGWKLKFLAQN